MTFCLTRALYELGRNAKIRSDVASSAIKHTGKLLVSICSPYDTILNKKMAKSVTLPGKEGVFSVSANHSPIVAELKAGLLTVAFENSETPEKYFMTDGFLFYKKLEEQNNYLAEIVCVEIAPVEHLDFSQTSTVLQGLLQSARTSPWDKMRHAMGQELCNSILKLSK